VKPEVLDLK